jgi:hypothetical protein
MSTLQTSVLYVPIGLPAGNKVIQMHNGHSVDHTWGYKANMEYNFKSVVSPASHLAESTEAPAIIKPS